MRRPLCVFCAGTLGLELVCAFLPQTGRFVPFAAFFIAGLLWTLAGRLRKSPAWGYGICLILEAVLGLVLIGSTQAKLDAIQTAYDGRSVLLEAEVESTTSSYSPGRVRAVLRVETVDREAASLRVECASLPACTPGDRVKGRFALEMPDDTARLNALADGIALNAAYEKGFALLGQSTSFRARTARLQKRLSAALRQGMASGPAGVLAAMVTGDRTHLSKELRTAYRGAGLSHVLVVSGMHVSILCGDVLGRLLPRRKKRLRSYTGRRVRALFSAVLALLLVGVTGFTPSVLRAAGAVWLSALGVWVYGPPDALTSLGVAGVLMTAGNSYAVCDVGFQLSFAAVVGTLAGGAVVRRSQEAWEKQRAKKKHPPPPVLEAESAWACGKSVGNGLYFGLRLHGHLPGAGAAGDEHQPVRAGVRCGGALAGGTHPAHRSGDGPAGACARIGPGPAGVFVLRGSAGRGAGPLGALGVRLARSTDLVRHRLCRRGLPAAGRALLAGVP